MNYLRLSRWQNRCSTYRKTHPRSKRRRAWRRGNQLLATGVTRTMKALFTKFVRDEEGQDLIEYGLLIGIITAGAIGFITPIGNKVSSYFSELNSALP